MTTNISVVRAWSLHIQGTLNNRQLFTNTNSVMYQILEYSASWLSAHGGRENSVPRNKTPIDVETLKTVLNRVRGVL